MLELLPELPPELPEDPPLEPDDPLELGEDGMEEEDDCCCGQPPISNAKVALRTVA
jgi:hypothetical protein